MTPVTLQILSREDNNSCLAGEACSSYDVIHVNQMTEIVQKINAANEN